LFIKKKTKKEKEIVHQDEKEIVHQKEDDKEKEIVHQDEKEIVHQEEETYVHQPEQSFLSSKTSDVFQFIHQNQSPIAIAGLSITLVFGAIATFQFLRRR